MAERAHPDDPSFHDKITFRFRKGFIPWWSRTKNPYRAAFQRRYSWVNQHCVGKDVLDIPCGMGWGTSLIKNCNSLVGVDLDNQSIAEAQSRYKKNIVFKQGDMSQLDFSDSSFDLISCLEGIEHVPADVGKSFISECARVLRPNGQLLISSPYCRTRTHSGNPYHIHEYSPDEITALLQTFFRIDNIETRDVDIMTVLYIECTIK